MSRAGFQFGFLDVFWAYMVGVLFFGAALAILREQLSRLAATLLALMFLSWVVIVHFPRVVSAPHDGCEWTSIFVALAMAGGGFIIAESVGTASGKLAKLPEKVAVEGTP
jgi:hypothetical protein